MADCVVVAVAAAAVVDLECYFDNCYLYWQEAHRTGKGLHVMLREHARQRQRQSSYLHLQIQHTIICLQMRSASQSHTKASKRLDKGGVQQQWQNSGQTLTARVVQKRVCIPFCHGLTKADTSCQLPENWILTLQLGHISSTAADNDSTAKQLHSQAEQSISVSHPVL